MNRFILDRKLTKQRVLSVIDSLPSKPVYVVEINEYKPTRSIEQNRLMWKILSMIENIISDDRGQNHSREWWHFYLRNEFGFTTDTMNIDGVDIPWPQSSTKFTVSQMADYITQLEAFAAHRGVFVDAA